MGSAKSNELIFNEICRKVKWMNHQTGYSGSAEINPAGELVINGEHTLSAGYPFSYLSATDVDMDGSIELIVVDETGSVYIYSDNGIIKPGFPVHGSYRSTVLSKDLFNDQMLELVCQTVDGDIVILDKDGKQIHKIANSDNNALIGLGEYQGKNAILTSSTIFLFSEASGSDIGEWCYPLNNPSNSSELIVKGTALSNNNVLFNKTLTYAYPNPARNETVVFRIEVIEADKIEIEIYDLAGQFVERLGLTETINNRPNEISWDTKEVESGIYFVNITAFYGSRTKTKIVHVGIIH
jgi:hypothetical protein